MTEAAKTLICSVCQKPRIIEWSEKWTPAERLFLISMLATISRDEIFFNKQRGDEWKEASPDCDWIMQIATARADTLHTDFADMVVKTVLEFDPDRDLDKWLKGIQERIYQ